MCVREVCFDPVYNEITEVTKVTEVTEAPEANELIEHEHRFKRMAFYRSDINYFSRI